MTLRLALSSVLLIAVGCAPSGVMSPSPQAAPTVGTPDVSSPARAAATATASTAPPTPVREALAIEWQRVAAVGLDVSLEDTSVRAVATGQGDLLVLHPRQDPMLEEYSPIPTLWRSADGRNWNIAELPDLRADRDELRDVATGEFGAVVVGRSGRDAAVWLSSDGRTWERIHDPGFRPGEMRMVARAPKGLVAFGTADPAAADPAAAIWTSVNGRDWLRATNESGLQVAEGVTALVAAPDRLTAFVGSSGTRDLGDRVEVWETSGRAEWRKVAEVVDAGGIYSAANGPLGWIALGETTWTSVDGRSWTKTPQAPGRVVAVTDVGFISASWTDTGGGGCAEPWPDFAEGATWTSPDARRWQKMDADARFQNAAIFRFVVRDRTLFGLGGSFDEGDGMVHLAVWSAPLPAASGAGGNDPRPTPRDEGAGCGGP